MALRRFTYSSDAGLLHVYFSDMPVGHADASFAKEIARKVVKENLILYLSVGNIVDSDYVYGRVKHIG